MVWGLEEIKPDPLLWIDQPFQILSKPSKAYCIAIILNGNNLWEEKCSAINTLCTSLRGRVNTSRNEKRSLSKATNSHYICIKQHIRK